MVEPVRKLRGAVFSAVAAAVFVLAAGFAFIWLLHAYHVESVYAELLRLAALADIKAEAVAAIRESMSNTDALAMPLRAAGAVVVLSSIVAARAAWLIASHNAEIEAERLARWEVQRQLQERTMKLRQNRQNLDRLNSLDGLTQIANREHVEAGLEREWRRAARVKGPLSMMLIDVDGMTEYNDLYGHLAGDDYLKRLARELHSLCGRPTDVVGRYDGDVFAIVLGATDSDGAKVIADAARRAATRVVEGLRDTPPPHLLTVSVGGVVARPQPDSQADMVVDVAVTKVEEAKKSGGNSVSLELPS